MLEFGALFIADLTPYPRVYDARTGVMTDDSVQFKDRLRYSKTEMEGVSGPMK